MFCPLWAVPSWSTSSGVHRATKASDASRYDSTLLSGSPEVRGSKGSSLTITPNTPRSRGACRIGSATRSLNFSEQERKTVAWPLSMLTLPFETLLQAHLAFHHPWTSPLRQDTSAERRMSRCPTSSEEPGGSSQQ